MRIVFIIPAHNECATIGFVLDDLTVHFPEATLLVVDDGSLDGTAEPARARAATVIQLPFNLGIGGAVQTGLLFADREGFDVAVQFDGDGQHRADQVHLLIDALRDSDVALGSRFTGSGDYRGSSLRRLGTWLFNVANSILLRQRFTDSTSGFRAYNRAVIQFLAENYAHDYPEAEAILPLARAGFRLTEVAVEMRPRHHGRSSITLWRSLYYMIKVPLAILVGATRSHTRRLS